MNSDVIEDHPKHRQALLRRTAYLAPGALLSTVILVYALTSLPQSLIMVFIVGIFAIPLDMEAVAALRDLSASPVTTEGRVERMWSKARFAFIGKVTYILVENKLFELGPVAGMELRLGDQVRVEHWPHSHTLVRITRLASAPSR
ncbi:MAG: hypothetical protein EPO65_02870 [Dehalococcoidia bacterium]|nr:MAG: hypothetical protein EPO65_02870 [Dehalococcoidia bacterium]